MEADLTKMPGVHRIVAERCRQIEVEGWTPNHDDKHRSGELSRAAACYAAHATVATRMWGDHTRWDEKTLKAYQNAEPPQSVVWPWAKKWWKPKNPDRDLVRAGALIAAELDRLWRLTPIGRELFSTKP